MHTSKTIRTAQFGFAKNGSIVEFDDVMPDFTVDDRVAVIASSPGGAFAAAALLLAAIGRYYELLAARSPDFYAYPDFYVLHVGELRGHHGWIDIWPEHKDVVVPADPQAILQAVSDRAITRLLIEETTPGTATLLRETVASATSRLKQAFVFGHPHDAGDSGRVEVTASDAARRYTLDAVQASTLLLTDARRDRLLTDVGRPSSFREITAADAVRTVCGIGTVTENFGLTNDYLLAHGVDGAVLDRHRARVE